MFRVRSARWEDLDALFALAKQFPLLNLPAKRQVLLQKLETSEKSFLGLLPKEHALYLFVLEDLERSLVIGSSLIIAKHGTPQAPHYAFEIQSRYHLSQTLGIGFIHQVLCLKQDQDGPTEIGGLILDRHYRSHPLKLGKLLSLSRFLFMAEFPERFENRVLVEFAPPLDDDGNSPFWEALGRRFTGLPYGEADVLSHSVKEFIDTLFPKSEIYTCLLDPAARAVIGQVSSATRPAVALLEKQGFKFKNQVDPFDGGPHFEAPLASIHAVAHSKKAMARSSSLQGESLISTFLVGFFHRGQWRCVVTKGQWDSGGAESATVYLPSESFKILELEPDSWVRVYELTS